MEGLGLVAQPDMFYHLHHPSMFPIAWRTFHHKPALVAPIILWLEYFLCAHHTKFPTSGCLCGPAQTCFFAYLALHGLHTTLHTLLCTSAHLCTPPCTPVQLFAL